LLAAMAGLEAAAPGGRVKLETATPRWSNAVIKAHR
jgi:hypothetical protein